MGGLDGAACEAAGTLGWACGCLAGVAIDTGILLAITGAARLREHREAPIESRAFKRWGPALPGLVAIAVWSGGLIETALEWRACYAPPSALAACIVAAVPMLVLFPLAAIKIARRSIW